MESLAQDVHRAIVTKAQKKQKNEPATNRLFTSETKKLLSHSRKNKATGLLIATKNR